MESTLSPVAISLLVLGCLILIIYILVRKYYIVKTNIKIGFSAACFVCFLGAGLLFNNGYISDRQLKAEANNIVEKAIQAADESALKDDILKSPD